MQPSTTIIIRRVPSTITEKEIVDAVHNQCGPDSIVQMNTIKPKGSAASHPVQIVDHRLVLKSLELAKSLVENKSITIGQANLEILFYQDPKEFKAMNEATSVKVEGLDGMSEGEIHKLFGQYGDIYNIQFIDGTTPSIVSYTRPGCAARAASELTQKQHDGRLLRASVVFPEWFTAPLSSSSSSVTTASASSSPASQEGRSDETHLAANKLNVIIKGTPLTGMTDLKALEELCQKFGPCTLTLGADTQSPNRKLAFVTFQKEENAESCITELNGKPLPPAVMEEIFTVRDLEREKSGAGEKTTAEKEEEEKMKTSSVVVQYVEEKKSPLSTATSSSVTSASATPLGTPRTPATHSNSNGLFLSGMDLNESETSLREKLHRYGDLISLRFTRAERSPDGRMKPWRATAFMATDQQAKYVLANGLGRISVQPFKTMEERDTEKKQQYMLINSQIQAQIQMEQMTQMMQNMQNMSFFTNQYQTPRQMGQMTRTPHAQHASQPLIPQIPALSATKRFGPQPGPRMNDQPRRFSTGPRYPAQTREQQATYTAPTDQRALMQTMPPVASPMAYPPQPAGAQLRYPQPAQYPIPHSTATSIPTIPHPPPAAPVSPVKPGGFDPAVLKTIPADQHRDTLGEYIYNKVEATHGELAGKITGMLLELPQDKILLIVQDPEMLATNALEAARLLGPRK